MAETTRQRYDLIIIGGGIIGSGIARDAALRGLRVALFEKRDFGGGTTAGSTRLIHGGLRYLEMLDFRLVRLDLRERETLLKIAPHLVKPLRFIVPFYESSLAHRAKMRLGMILYDLLSFDKSLPRHRVLDAAEVRAAEPGLRADNLRGAVAYYDAQVFSPERLCLENLIDAREHGAHVYNYAEVTAAIRSGKTVNGVRVRDTLSATGEEMKVKGRVVVNASGPWFDRVAGNLNAQSKPRIRTTKGIHIACPPLSRHALVLFSNLDGRLFFVIPLMGYSWIGTTDTDYREDPGAVHASASDVEYLTGSVKEFVPDIVNTPIHFSNAGVRALVLEEGSESSLSRMHRISDGEKTGAPGLVSVLGGKLTGYRAIAEEVVDVVCAKLVVKVPCRTATTPLPGARPTPTAVAAASSVDEETAAHLSGLYGSRAVEVMRLAASDSRLRERLAPEYPDIAAQVVHAVRSEQCLRLSDFILRRTTLGFSDDQGRGAVQEVAALMARELGWTQERVAAEVQAFDEHLAMTQSFRHRAVKEQL
ncbi:MAG TPA: glycerol-3-phosphate dehydrogenase/oxidase [Pyrinomonadaceae bacterium]|nr:glycerol-3-phosphate dehydrogenase/oxidase [Pyrinomonadaceae bacterium]